MKNFEELSNFIKNNSDWLNKLKPWLKTVHECDYNSDWVILMYNLFDIPSDQELYKIICECRGSVVNKKTGEIITAPFVKFWNYGEERADKDIDWKNAYYTAKRDGWLCKCSKYNGKVYAFTNGMYLSDNNRGAPVEESIHPEYNFKTISDVFLYCLKADGFSEDGSVYWKELPRWVKSMHDGDTIMFELESPWNVVHTQLVEEPTLWLIGYRDYDGEERNIYEFNEAEAEIFNFKIPMVYNFNSAEQLLSEMKEWKIDKEGEGIVVLSIDDGYNFHRVKIKCDDYLKVKYSAEASNMSDNSLFRLMLTGELDDIIAAQPQLLPRVEIIKLKFNDFKKQVSAAEISVTKMAKQRFSEKKELVAFLKKHLPKTMLFYLSCMRGDYLEKKVDFWKIKKNGYDEMCKILNDLDLD